ncbi:MAG: DHHA1 domain-containing protein, partial [Candidatus Bipolaricaulota bacterium]
DAGHGRCAFEGTPFYAEAGGQIADTGWIENLTRQGKADVHDVKRTPQGTLHLVAVTEGEFHVGDRCRLRVNEARRRAIARAHTATHLLHAALRHVLGEHVIQAGSSVGPEELRFDFTHFAALSAAELARVEELAFAPVLQDLPVQVEEIPLAEAKARGAIAHFEEEYSGKDRVRVVAVPGTSAELCGGTHVRRTGEIGLIVILAEEAVAAGTRRVRAVVGDTARRYLVSLREERHQLSALTGVPETEIVAGMQRSLDEAQALRRRVAALEAELATVRSQDLLARARDVDGTKLLCTMLDGGAEEAKRLADALAARLGRCVVVVGVRHEGRGLIVAKVVDEPRVGAGDLVRVAAEALGGKGGGRSTFAQGGGPDVQALPQAIERALALAEDKLRGA